MDAISRSATPCLMVCEARLRAPPCPRMYEAWSVATPCPRVREHSRARRPVRGVAKQGEARHLVRGYAKQGRARHPGHGARSGFERDAMSEGLRVLILQAFRGSNDGGRWRSQLAVSHQRSQRFPLCSSCEDSIRVDRFHLPCLGGGVHGTCNTTFPHFRSIQDYRLPLAEDAVL